MSDAAQLQKVLDRIDTDFDNSLERLFALLRIKSISADPAFALDCKMAADHLARDIATLGFTSEVRPTAVIRPSSPKATQTERAARGRASCSMGIMTCSRSIRSISGTVRRSSLPSPIMPTDGKSSLRAGRRTTRAS